MKLFNSQEQPDELPDLTPLEESNEEESSLNAPLEEASVRVPSIPDPN